MADLLAHVLVAYAVLTVVGWRLDWLDQQWVVVGMCGAAIPDLGKVNLVVHESTIRSALGVPFTYAPLATIGGVVLVAGIVTQLFAHDRRRVFGLLVAGGGLSLLGDALRAYADGHSEFFLYPVLYWRPPTPSLYVSSDLWVTAVAIGVAVVVFAVDRYVA